MDSVSFEASLVGLTIQWVGVILTTALSFLLTQSIRRRFFQLWTLAWACLTLGLSALLIALTLHPNWLLHAVYLFAEYAFCFLLILGCRNYVQGVNPTRGQFGWLIPGGLLALGLPQLADDINLLFIPHAAIMASLFATACGSLRGARHRLDRGPGLRVTSVALVLLTLLFLHYIPVHLYAVLHGLGEAFPYMRYSSLYDLLLEILLAFGTVMLLMERVVHELEAANQELTAAGQRLQALVQRDPLTEALNRHAFHSFVEKSHDTPARSHAGCVVVLDVDNLKTLNDTYGHAAGDEAIRAVAKAIRSVIRADDLLFRWGGDEFLVLLVGVAEVEARARFGSLNDRLLRTPLTGATAAIDLHVSYGIAGFADAATLEPAIAGADREMYQRKQAGKNGSSQPPEFTL